MNESRKNHTEVFSQDKRDGDIMDGRDGKFFFCFFRNVSFALFLENGIVYLRDLKKRESGEVKPEARLLVIRSVD